MNATNATALLVSPETGHVCRRVNVTSLDQVAALHHKFPRYDVGVCLGAPEKFREGDPQWTYFPALET